MVDKSGGVEQSIIKPAKDIFGYILTSSVDPTCRWIPENFAPWRERGGSSSYEIPLRGRYACAYPRDVCLLGSKHVSYPFVRSRS